jgi:hypothetical protein
MNNVVSRRSMAVGAMSRELKELIGEHEAILAYMETLTKTAENLAAQPALARDRLWNYRHGLYDFKDAIWYHLEIDERVFKSLFGDAYQEDPIEEHRQIQQLVEDMISLANNAFIDRMGQEELNQYCAKIGTAFKKICELIELHIAKENTILQRVQDALNHR